MMEKAVTYTRVQLLLWEPIVCAPDRPGLARTAGVPPVTAKGCVVASAAGMFIDTVVL